MLFFLVCYLLLKEFNGNFKRFNLGLEGLCEIIVVVLILFIYFGLGFMYLLICKDFVEV